MRQAVDAPHPVQDLGRLLHGGAPQAQAGRRADARACSSPAAASRPRTSRTRSARPAPRRRGPGRCSTRARSRSRRSPRRRRGRCATKCGLCAAGLPLRGHRPGQEGKEVGARGRGGLRRLRHLRGATCAFGAISMRHFTDDQIMAQIDAILSDQPEEKVFVFACNWCSLRRRRHGRHLAASSTRRPAARADDVLGAGVGGDGAGGLPPRGAGGAGVGLPLRRLPLHQRQPADGRSGSSGCGTSSRRPGIRPERLQLEWISAAEGQKFARGDVPRSRSCARP